MIEQTHHSRKQITTKIKAYITETFLTDREDFVLTNNFQLIEQGVINSMGILRLITFLEEAFGATLEAPDIVLENFATVEAIATLLLSKQLEPNTSK